MKPIEQIRAVLDEYPEACAAIFAIAVAIILAMLVLPR